MPKLPSRLPLSLSRPAGSGELFSRSGIAYNYAIGGLPFLSAASREHPIVRETAPVRKQQFDAAQNAGEQSLDGYWLRSQQSFHGGAGQLFGDPDNENPFSSVRFRASKGVNPWNQGRVSLLNNVVKASYTPIPGVTDMTEFNFGDGTPAAFGVTATNMVVVVPGSGTNLIINPNFETNIAGWSASPGTATHSTAQAHEGVGSLLLTPDGVSAQATARATLVPATAGKSYTSRVWVRCAVARNVSLTIDWYNGGGGLFSGSGNTVAVLANTWTEILVTATAPATTAQAGVTISMGTTPPGSHLLHIDEVFFATSVVNTDFPASALANQSVTTDGRSIFVTTLDGVYSAPIPSTPTGTFVWTKQYNITGPPVHCHTAFVKSRIILAVDNKIYELAPYPVTPPAALPSALYTHPDPTWKWTGITETSPAIFVCGNNTVRGSIVKLVLKDDGTLPVLTGGAIAAQLPSGEVIYSAMGYLGSFVAIGTNKGIRVGVADQQGNITYGPLLFDSIAPVKAWTARDRFLWATVPGGVDGNSGLYRIDLSTQVAELRFPYATDLTPATQDVSDCVAVANLGSSNLCTFATSNDLYVEDASALAASGYIQTSRIRYSTVEPKLFKLVRVRGPVLAGPLAITVFDSTDADVGSHVLGEAVAPGQFDVSIAAPSAPTDFVSFKFSLTRNTTNLTAGGEMWAYQVKALPGATRQRMIQLPLWCFDWEKDGNGAKAGGKGSAASRLRALEDLESSGTSVTLQDFNTGESVQCVIERLSFQQTTPPAGSSGWGGVVTVVLRTLL